MKQKAIVPFTQADVGASVIFAGFDGGSYSATVIEVHTAGIPLRDQTVRVRYFPAGKTPVFATLTREDWGRLTRFGNSMFLALPAEPEFNTFRAQRVAQAGEAVIGALKIKV